MFGLNEADLKAVLARAAEVQDVSLIKELEFMVEIRLIAGEASERWVKIQADPKTIGKVLASLGPVVTTFPERMRELWEMAHQDKA